MMTGLADTGLGACVGYGLITSAITLVGLEVTV